MYIIILSNKFTFFIGLLMYLQVYVFQMLHISLDDTCEICACIMKVNFHTHPTWLSKHHNPNTVWSKCNEYFEIAVLLR